MIRLEDQNDTKMNQLNVKQQKIISLFLEQSGISSSRIFSELTKRGVDTSLVTTKRLLSEMVANGYILKSGSGRSVRYKISALGRIFADVDAKAYSTIEPDKRYGLDYYNFELFTAFPGEIFTPAELQPLDEATAIYKEQIKDSSPALQKKELERLIIELSWKSSKIEGNTYTLLDTEKLILEHKEAPGHGKEEARMILNHKDAFDFIHGQKDLFRTLTSRGLEKLHATIVKDLSVNFGFRKKPVGVTGSKYRPLDNIYQISEAISALQSAVSRMQTPYAKSLLALLGISYVQPFEDGNKRTARLMANAILLAYGLAPLSYRSVDENEYREAMLVWYEINSIVPFKKIFTEQYNFAAKNYAVI